eukprot:TRINITY_DN3202_c6_g1_i1.p1 TRINITY_DN3202_c6_g1~~TRINITY_DN3202_c6_g1_i1.p1  ORF type:complete len:911 (+),score=198.47 TRINITY_DN3202_c6_g1_i1:51-2735(+)
MPHLAAAAQGRGEPFFASGPAAPPGSPRRRRRLLEITPVSTVKSADVLSPTQEDHWSALLTSVVPEGSPRGSALLERRGQLRQEVLRGPPETLREAVSAVIREADSCGLPARLSRRCVLESVGYLPRARRQPYADRAVAVLVAAAWHTVHPEGSAERLADELRVCLSEEFCGAKYTPPDDRVEQQASETVDFPAARPASPHLCSSPATTDLNGAATTVRVNCQPTLALSAQEHLVAALRMLGQSDREWATQVPSISVQTEFPTTFSRATTVPAPEHLRLAQFPPPTTLSRRTDQPEPPGSLSVREQEDWFNEQKMEEIRAEFFRISAQHPDPGRPNALGFSAMKELWFSVFPSLPPEDVGKLTERLFVDIDTNDDGAIDWPELFGYLTQDECDSEAPDDELHLPSVLRPEGFQQWMWALLEVSASECYQDANVRLMSTVAQFAIQLTILASTTNLVLESMPRLNGRDTTNEQMGTQANFVVELGSVALFTIELMLRVASCPCAPPPPELCRRLISQRNLWTRWFTWIDVMAIIPFYIRIAGLSIAGSRSLVVLRLLRMLRLSRVLRILKLGRYSEGISIMLLAFKRASYVLIWMMLLMLMLVLISATLIFYMELGDDAHFDPDYGSHGAWVTGRGDSVVPTIFQSIPDAMWWSVVTITTVGYGDSVPRTTEGKMIAVLTMIAGLLLVAFPVTILSNAFTQVFNEWMARKRKRQRRRELNRIHAWETSVSHRDDDVREAASSDASPLTATRRRSIEEQLAASRSAADPENGRPATTDSVRRHSTNPLLSHRDSSGSLQKVVSTRSAASATQGQRPGRLSGASTSDVSIALRKLGALTGRNSADLLRADDQTIGRMRSDEQTPPSEDAERMSSAPSATFDVPTQMQPCWGSDAPAP